ncbi:MAG: hypothetical protein R3A48_01405 [Polyangiales bacterium]
MPSRGTDLSLGTPFRHAPLRVPALSRGAPRWRLISSPRLARLRDGVIVGGALLMLTRVLTTGPWIHRVEGTSCLGLSASLGMADLPPPPPPERLGLSAGLALAVAFALVGCLLGVVPWHLRSAEARLRDDRGERLAALFALAFAASGFVGTRFFAPASFTRPVSTLMFLAAWSVVLMTRTR